MNRYNDNKYEYSSPDSYGVRTYGPTIPTLPDTSGPAVVSIAVAMGIGVIGAILGGLVTWLIKR